VFSSRKLERATYNSVTFRFIAANDPPDHDTIATFGRRFLKEIKSNVIRYGNSDRGKLRGGPHVPADGIVILRTIKDQDIRHTAD
jgi:hypothetical protein